MASSSGRLRKPAVPEAELGADVCADPSEAVRSRAHAEPLYIVFGVKSELTAPRSV